MILNVESLSKFFHQGGQKIEVIKDLNFSLEKGETLAILGESGSGKSTLLSLLAGLDYPDTGEIKFLDYSIGNLGEKELAQVRLKDISIVFQNFYLLPHLRAIENITLPLELQGQKNVLDKGKKLLESVNLSERAYHFPAQLSGGEKQRIAIARALAPGPGLLLADEPSGSLDEKTGIEIMNLLFDLVKKEEMSMILVTHNIELAHRCNRVLYLRNGQLISEKD